MNSAVARTSNVPWWPRLPSPAVAGVSGLLLVYLGIWMLLTPYAGLSHDAQAYAFQALARLDPAGLGQDVFLRFASQDRYTVFPSIYAALAQPLGIEATAALLTLICHAAWYGAAYLLSRHLFGPTLALLSLGLLVTFPGIYGGLRIFHVAEPFLTARLPTEAVVLAALACWHAERRIAAGLLLLLGMAIHPLMAFPGLLLLGMLLAEQHHPADWTMPVGAAVVTVMAVAGSALLGGSSATMTDAWLEVARLRSGHLFPDYWSADDWNAALVTLATLGTAGLLLPAGTARSFARAAMWLGAAGLALTIVSAEIWHSKLLLQGQPWRWMWLARVTAVAALPAACLVAWRCGVAGRAVALLVAASWLVVLPVGARGTLPSLMGSILCTCALALAASRTRMATSTQTLVYRGGLAILALVVIAAVVTASLRWMTYYEGIDLSRGMQRLVTLASLVTPAAALVLACWWAVQVRRGPVLVTVVAVLGAALTGTAVTFAAPLWMARTYSGANLEKFSGWRALIPRDAEVFWWDGLREVWFLLQRTSYLTSSQGGGVVFSPDLSAELRRRAENTSAYIDPGYFFNEPASVRSQPRPLTEAILQSVCRDPELGFVVARQDAGAIAAPIDWPGTGESAYLHDCRRHREDTP